MCRVPSMSHVINLVWNLRPVWPGLILCSLQDLDHRCSSSCPVIQDESVHACQDSVRESTWAPMLHLSRLSHLCLAPFILWINRPPLWFHLNSLSGGIPSHAPSLIKSSIHIQTHILCPTGFPRPTGSPAPSWSFSSSSDATLALLLLWCPCPPYP